MPIFELKCMCKNIFRSGAKIKSLYGCIIRNISADGVVIMWRNNCILVYKDKYYLETVVGVFLKNHVLELKKSRFRKIKRVCARKSDREVLDCLISR